MALPEMIKQFLECGVHFGHLSKHWNPRMKKFIFGKKKNVYVINLEKTLQQLEQAKEFVQKIAQDEGEVLFVGTKRQLRDTVKTLAEKAEMPYIVERWVGGFLTNFSTIRTRVKKYIELSEEKAQGKFERFSGKEKVRLNRELQRMEKNYSGVVDLQKLPDCVYIIDPKREDACVREARKLGIPIVALVDTDANPDLIDYPIPGNDDAIKSVRCIASELVDAILKGKQHGKELRKQATQAGAPQPDSQKKSEGGEQAPDQQPTADNNQSDSQQQDEIEKKQAEPEKE